MSRGSGADLDNVTAESEWVFLPHRDELEFSPEDGRGQTLTTGQGATEKPSRIGRFRRLFRRQAAAHNEGPRLVATNPEIPAARSKPFLQSKPKSISTGKEVDGPLQSVFDSVALTADLDPKSSSWHGHSYNSGGTASAVVQRDKYVAECANSAPSNYPGGTNSGLKEEVSPWPWPEDSEVYRNLDSEWYGRMAKSTGTLAGNIKQPKDLQIRFSASF